MRVTSHDLRRNRRIYASRFRQTSSSRMETYFREMLLEVVSLDLHSHIVGQLKFLLASDSKPDERCLPPKIRCTPADTSAQIYCLETGRIHLISVVKAMD